ncbi:MAG: class I SAM-dependent RNA methyltransferase [Anaerolineaceae bacterium]|nr:class I SAM-dependent RNA methyltransferase [Anaerolineaceae bacterium]
MTTNNIFEISLTGLIYGGEAIGRLPDGRAVFVPYALPGERVRLQLVEEKRGHARAELLDVINPSPERTVPRCSHFGVCGGCHYQHTSYRHQLEIKRAVLREQLQRIGGIVDPPVTEPVAAPDAWQYRNTIQFHVDGEGGLGFIGAGGQQVVAVSECHLPEAALDETGHSLNFDPGSGIERVELRLDCRGEVLLTLESQTALPPYVELDMPVSIVHRCPAGSVVVAGEDFSWMQVKDKLFRVSPESFFQVNSAMAGLMVDHLLKRLPITQGGCILDVYAGVGLFSAFIAPHVSRCIAIELSTVAAEDFALNLDSCDNVELYVGAAEEVMPALDVRPQAVIVDPPRSGLMRPALDAIARLQAPCVTYISCDPSTLARDAGRLAHAGYTLQEVTSFDMFPQTYHIESVSIFSLDENSGGR